MEHISLALVLWIGALLFLMWVGQWVVILVRSENSPRIANPCAKPDLAVFGREFNEDCTPERRMLALLEAARELYFQGLVGRIFLAGGDHGMGVAYATLAMQWLVARGVPQSCICTPVDELDIHDRWAWSTYGEACAFSPLFRAPMAVLCERSNKVRVSIYLLANGVESSVDYTVDTDGGKTYNLFGLVLAILDPFNFALRFVERPLKQWFVPLLRRVKTS